MGQSHQTQGYDRAKHIVDRFVGQFGAPKPYRKLAWYAAIPLVLTPELLNYLRNTFLRGEVPWVAEVDLLLSEVCQLVGYELYAMDTEVRAYLLSEMRTQLGVERMQDVARLLIHYVRHLSQTNPLVAEHQLQAQQWAAMVYLDEHREQAVREIAEAFRNSAIDGIPAALPSVGVIDHAEFARLSLITQKLAPELIAYPDLVQYAQQIGQMLASFHGTQTLPPDRYLDHPTPVLGVTLPGLRALLPTDQQTSHEHRATPDDPEVELTLYEYDVFVSYSRADEEWVKNVLLPLLEEYRLTFAIDKRDFEVGSTWSEQMQRMLDASHHILLVLTPTYLSRDWNDLERAILDSPEAAQRQRKLFGVMLKDYPLPPKLADLRYIDFTNIRTHDAQLTRLAWTLREPAGGLATEVVPSQYDVFIDYSHRNRNWVLEFLLPQLDAAGVKVCIDERDFELGAPIMLETERALHASRYILLVLTPDYMQSDWTVPLVFPKEFEAAKQQFRILPLMFQYCDLPKQLAELNYANFTVSSQWDRQIPRLVQHLQEAPDQPLGTYDAYISYSYHNREWVWNELLTRLDNAGLRVYIDIRTFRFGVPTTWSIEQGINNSRHVVCVMTQGWVQSQWAQQELQFTLAARGRQRKLLPILLEPCDIPRPLRDILYLNLTKPETRDSEIIRLIRMLGGDVPTSIKVLRVVVVAPGDVQAESHSLADVVAELNQGVAKSLGIRIELVRWETDVFPGFHAGGPQGMIDPIISIEDVDLLIGIFWQRFGTPTADNISGTEHELRIAYRSWKRLSRPQIMLYFNQQPFMPRSPMDVDLQRQLLEFKKEFPQEGVWWSYKGKVAFQKLVKQHLMHFVQRHDSQAKQDIGLEGPAIARIAEKPYVEGDQLVTEPVSALTLPEREAPVDATMDSIPNFYVERDSDRIALESIKRQGVTITIRGPRQIGKSSLLLRIVDTARREGKRVAFLDFQLFDREVLTDADLFFPQFCSWLTHELELDDRVSEYWTRDKDLSNPQLCTHYIGRYLLEELASPLVLALDEVETILDTDFRSDFFGMLRAWHNNRFITPIWRQLDVVLATSTEPYQLINNIHQSPFNVGQIIELTDFTLDHVLQLNLLYGGPLAQSDLQRLMALLNGQPYLTQRALYLVASQRMTVSDLFTTATSDQGPFGDHLRYHLFRIHDKPELIKGLLQVLRTQSCSDEGVFFKLHSAGLVAREGRRVVIHNSLYAEYFSQHLLQASDLS